MILPLYAITHSDPSEGCQRYIAVQRHIVTGVYDIRVQDNPVRFSLKKEGEPDVTAVWHCEPHQTERFVVEMAITSAVKVHGVRLDREGGKWNGEEFIDVLGQRWKRVWMSEASTQFYQENPDSLRGRVSWSGSVMVDDDYVVFREDTTTDGTPASLWYLVP